MKTPPPTTGLIPKALRSILNFLIVFFSFFLFFREDRLETKCYQQDSQPFSTHNAISAKFCFYNPLLSLSAPLSLTKTPPGAASFLIGLFALSLLSNLLTQIKKSIYLFLLFKQHNKDLVTKYACIILSQREKEEGNPHFDILSLLPSVFPFSLKAGLNSFHYF